MEFNVLTIIIIITGVISVSAFSNRELSERLLYSPYAVKHNHETKRILGHILIHADWMHLIFNMMSLYFLGSIFLSMSDAYYYQGIDSGLMQKYGVVFGQMHFLAIYILGALVASIIPYFRHQDNPNYKAVGASGAVSAIIFAAIIWNPGMKLSIMFLPFGIPAYIFGPLYLLYEWYADRRGGSGIAHDAHIGGAIFGILYILIINIDKGKQFLSYFL